MANVLNVIIRNNQLLSIKNLVKAPKVLSIYQNNVRTLYASSTLGIDSYIQQRQRTSAQLSNIADKFKQKMIDYTSDDAKNMIFTEDLKNMAHIAEKDDVDLVIKMMIRFNEQNKQLRFGNFVFGPVIMRMLHHLNKPDEAIKCFTSPQLDGFFDQLMTYQLLLDLLYENGRYQDMLQMFENIKGRQVEGTKFPRNIVVLTMAACYKLNTPESMKFAMKLWSDLQEVGHQPMRRAVTFYAGLMLNQKQPEAALEIVSSANNQNYTTVRNLKVAALIEVGRIDDVLPLLKSVLTPETTNIKHTYNKDVLDKVNQAVQNKDEEMKEEFKRIMEIFNQQGLIEQTTLDEQLCKEIVSPPNVGQHRQNMVQRFNTQTQSYDRRTKFSQDRFVNRRPGLSELQ